MSDIDKLTQTLSEIQSKEFPEIPKELVISILSIQDKYSLDRAESLKIIRKLVEDYIKSVDI